MRAARAPAAPGRVTAVLTWAITRAARESNALVDQLTTQGLHALALPCIERSTRPVSAWRPPGQRVIVLTSVAAVEAVSHELVASAPAHLAALSPHTSAALAKLELTATIESSEGVVALAQAIARSLDGWNIRAASFWYPTSSAGHDAPEQAEAIAALTPYGPVTRVAAYDVAAPSGLIDQLRTLPREVGVLFSSPSAVKHFITAHEELGLTPSVRLAACWGDSTRRAAQAHFSRTHLLPRARNLADALRELELSHG